MPSDVDIVVTPHHRARITVKRLLRADEVVMLLRDVVACMSGDRAPVVVADWGDMFIEANARLEGYVDVYPLGWMAYQMLTGSEPPSPTYFVPGAPPLLAKLIVRMLAYAVDERPDIQEVKSVVGIMLGEEPLAPPPVFQEELLELIAPARAVHPPTRTRIPPPSRVQEELLDLDAPPAEDDELLTLK